MCQRRPRGLPGSSQASCWPLTSLPDTLHLDPFASRSKRYSQTGYNFKIGKRHREVTEFTQCHHLEQDRARQWEPGTWKPNEAPACLFPGTWTAVRVASPASAPAPAQGHHDTFTCQGQELMAEYSVPSKVQDAPWRRHCCQRPGHALFGRRESEWEHGSSAGLWEPRAEKKDLSFTRFPT